ncbi:PAS domain S-box protein [Echinicola sp. CAU 1574]|uniref:histidine kinase n=1 Tax=Echinicola arenosa TaxID=2774144 RepID=A0ABR9AJI1_9BACT|nr:PAS domain S-box protein [Echinicola arenosa]MBD8488982.1 PAS domain S-box protein [Echinicola arenosa]
MPQKKTPQDFETALSGNYDRLLNVALMMAKAKFAFVAVCQEGQFHLLSEIGFDEVSISKNNDFFINKTHEIKEITQLKLNIDFQGQSIQSLIISPFINGFKESKGFLILIEPSEKVSQETLSSIALLTEEINSKYINKLELENINYSENQFRNFFEESMGLMCTHDLKGKLLLINNASARSLGYEKNELLGKSLFDIIPKHHVGGIKHYLDEILQKGHSSGTMKTLHKDGSERMWLYTNVLQKNIHGDKFILGNALDISERYKLEYEYNRLKEMLEQTNSVARVGGWEADFINNTLYWSDVTREIHEVSDDFIPDSENAISFYKEGKNQEAIKRAFENAITKGESYDLELELITAKGKEIWVRAIGKPQFKDGKCVRLFGTFQDVDEKKQAELEIIRSKKLLEDVQNASSEVSIISTNTEGIITLFNKGAEKMLGYSAEEMIGQQSPAIIHDPTEIEERGKELSSKYNQSITGFKVFVYKSEIYGAEEREWSYIRKDGTKLFVSLAVTTMRNTHGEITGYLGMATDITERKKAENALFIEKARLNAFVTHAPAAVAMFDTDIKYIAYSNRWLEEYQLQGQDIKNKSHYEVFESISDEWKAIHARCLKGEVISNEEDVWRPDGWDHDQYLRWEVRPWHQFDGTIGGIMMLTQDITEACLQRDELKKAKIMAEQASIAKSEFLANMSHEIRTPLNGVIGFTDLVLKTELTDTQAQYLSIVNQSGNALLNIINDILDFSKIEAGKLDLDTDKCDLYELSDQASDIITYEIHKKGLEMLLNIHPDIPRYIWVDSVRLKQVMVNLLGNASKFTEEGEIELMLKPLGKINENNEMKIRFSVSDTGIGIKPEKQIKIFEAFSQEDISTTKKYGGTGLGLTISNSLLKLMDSKLQLESVPGKGSKFFFDLKVKCEYGDPEVWQTELGINHVLIVDDNDNNRIILDRMLALRGIATDQAKNGFEAIQKLIDGNKYDVILMDYHMPYMNGIETIRKIRESFEHQPIIFLHSSSDDENILKACKELNINMKLVKPIKIQEMYDALMTINRKQDHKKSKSQKAEKKSIFPKDTKIMIVEDNSINMLLAKTVVNNLSPSTKILEAQNGIEALELCKKDLPDIIFMDIQMPEMNGYEATKEIRQLYNKHNILIIALTAGNIKGEREKCMNAGMNDFIAKPFVEEDLIKLLEKWELKQSHDLVQNFKELPSLAAFDIENLKEILGFPDVESEMFQIILKSGKKELINSREDIIKIHKTKSTGLSLAAHKLYGSACTMRMDRLAELSAKIETRKEYNFDDQNLLNDIDAILKEIQQAITALDQYIKD